jgi:enoyl-CoA hydratase/carnithine racemase
MTATLSLEVSDQTFVVTMQRPEVLNAVDDQMKAELVDALEGFVSDEALRVLILTGSDCGAFCTGSDLSKMAKKFDQSHELVSRSTAPPYFRSLIDCPKPMIAAIDGYCVGGGFEMALTCDIRIATRRSSFGLPEPRVGMVGEYGLDNLSRLVPLGEALCMQLTGSRMDAERAYQIGLIQRLTEDRDALLATARGIAGEICRCSPLAVRTIKQVVRVGRDIPSEDAHTYSQPFRELVLTSDDAAEGARAFAEKRSPRWVTV